MENTKRLGSYIQQALPVLPPVLVHLDTPKFQTRDLARIRNCLSFCTVVPIQNCLKWPKGQIWCKMVHNMVIFLIVANDNCQSKQTGGRVASKVPVIIFQRKMHALGNFYPMTLLN